MLAQEENIGKSRTCEMRPKLKKCCGVEPKVIERRVVFYGGMHERVGYTPLDSDVGIPERFVQCPVCKKRTADEFDYDNLYVYKQLDDRIIYRSKATAEELWNGVEHPRGGDIDFIVMQLNKNVVYEPDDKVLWIEFIKRFVKEKES